MMKLVKWNTYEYQEKCELVVDEEYVAYVTNCLHACCELYDVDIKNINITVADIEEIMLGSPGYKGRLANLMIKTKDNISFDKNRNSYYLWWAIQEQVDEDIENNNVSSEDSRWVDSFYEKED